MRTCIRLTRAVCLVCALVLTVSMFLVSCQPSPVRVTSTLPLKEIVLYDWEPGIPKTLIDQFTAQTGIQVRSVSYGSQEEAVQALHGDHDYDVVVMENQYVPHLIADGLLAKIDSASIPNFKNISPNFKDLMFDPQNQYSIPYSWGITGLVVRTDMIHKNITSWDDLWDLPESDTISMWNLPRYNVGVALKALGYSANSADPDQLKQAGAYLEQLRSRTLLENFVNAPSPILAEGKAGIGIDFTYDIRALRAKGIPVKFIIPSEGTIIWQDNFLIPARSQVKTEAAAFINFLLEPESGAVLTEYNRYATCNEASYSRLPADILNDPIIFPTGPSLQQADLLIGIPSAGESLYAELWNRFIGH